MFFSPSFGRKYNFLINYEYVKIKRVVNYDDVIYYAVNYLNYVKVNLEHFMVSALVVVSKPDAMIDLMVYLMFDYLNYHYLVDVVVFVVFVYVNADASYHHAISFSEGSNCIHVDDCNSISDINVEGGIIISVVRLIYVLYKEVDLNLQNVPTISGPITDDLMHISFDNVVRVHMFRCDYLYPMMPKRFFDFDLIVVYVVYRNMVNYVDY